MRPFGKELFQHLKLRAGVKRQKSEFPKKRDGLIPHTSEQINKIAVEVIINVKRVGLPAQQYRTGPAEDIDESLRPLRQNGIDIGQQGGLISHPRYRTPNDFTS